MTTTETITAANVGTFPAAVLIETPSKAKIARAVFAEMFAMSPVPPRKDMIARAKKEAGLTDSGAATYLQNYKSKHNLTTPRVVMSAVPVAEVVQEAAMA